MPDTAAVSLPDLLALIAELWGYRQLRPLQQQAMEAVLDKRDSVVVMPTGGGKSLCYQAPAIHLARCGRGPTVVVSPLIAPPSDDPPPLCCPTSFSGETNSMSS